MNGRTATVRYIAGEERLSIPEPAERWPSAWGHGEGAFSRSFAADAARRLPEFPGYRLADMDAAGIDVQGLSHTVPGLLGGQRRDQRRTTGHQQRTGNSPPPQRW
jgi:hypothetical protein